MVSLSSTRLAKGMQVYSNIDIQGEFRAPVVLGAQAGPAPPAPAAAVAIAPAPGAPRPVPRGVDGDLEDHQEPDGSDLEDVPEEDSEAHADVKDVVVGQETLVINTRLVSIDTLDQSAKAEICVVDQDLQIGSLSQNQTPAIGTSDQLEASEEEFPNGHSDNILQEQISTHPDSDTMFVATVGPFQMAPSLPLRLVNSILEAVQLPQTAAKADGSKSARLISPFKSD